MHLPEADAAKLTTPGLLIDYLVDRLPPDSQSPCLDQVAFHRLRQATVRVFSASRAAIRPDTTWSSILPSGPLRQSWSLLQHTVGVPAWPKLSFFGSLSGDAETVGATARFIATHCPAALKGLAGSWTRAQVIETVTRLMASELGIELFRMDDRFVEDLHLD